MPVIDKRFIVSFIHQHIHSIQHHLRTEYMLLKYCSAHDMTGSYYVYLICLPLSLDTTYRVVSQKVKTMAN